MMGNPSKIKNSIVLVPFPFDDFTGVKVRPAICLTSPIGIHNHIVVAFISSKIPNTLDRFEILLDSNSGQFATSGLMMDSVIKLNRLVTIPKSLIKRKLGTIANSAEVQLVTKLKELFEI